MSLYSEQSHLFNEKADKYISFFFLNTPKHTQTAAPDHSSCSYVLFCSHWELSSE